jgi:hypothetical protein
LHASGLLCDMPNQNRGKAFHLRTKRLGNLCRSKRRKYRRERRLRVPAVHAIAQRAHRVITGRAASTHLRLVHRRRLAEAEEQRWTSGET